MWKTGVEHTNTSKSEATEYHFPVSREKMGTVSETIVGQVGYIIKMIN